MIPKKTLFACAILLIFFILFLPGYTKLQELRDKDRDLEAKIQKLKHENALLQREIQRINNDALYREEIVREKMGVVRKDEIPVRIVPDEKR
jgi:cell division protein FtsB